MNLAAIKTSIAPKLIFQFQGIVDAHGKDQNWIEMLYRPLQMMGNENLDDFFKSLSPEQKIDLDIQIFNQLVRIKNEMRPDRLSVNLNPISLLSSSFRCQFRKLLEKDLIHPNKICIEIIETHSMPPLTANAIDLLKKFRNQGGWVALDDFGSGFAHWELLQMGLIDVIKVANQNLLHSGLNSFTSGLAKFADSMSIKTVLEGVETAEQFINGKSQGFQNFQGWYFK